MYQTSEPVGRPVWPLYPLLPPAGPSLALNDLLVGSNIGLILQGLNVFLGSVVKEKQVFTFSLLLKSAIKQIERMANTKNPAAYLFEYVVWCKYDEKMVP